MKYSNFIINLLAPGIIIYSFIGIFSRFFTFSFRVLNNLIIDFSIFPFIFISILIFLVSNSIISIYKENDQSIKFRNLVLSGILSFISIASPLIYPLILSHFLTFKISIFSLIAIPIILGAGLARKKILLTFPSRKMLLFLLFTLSIIYIIVYQTVLSIL